MHAATAAVHECDDGPRDTTETNAERPAAASVTAVPKSLAAALGPLLSGWLLSLSGFGWPLVIAGALKGVYDVLLLVMFKAVRPPEEAERHDEVPREPQPAR
jgi:MFS family permease